MLVQDDMQFHGEDARNILKRGDIPEGSGVKFRKNGERQPLYGTVEKSDSGYKTHIRETGDSRCVSVWGESVDFIKITDVSKQPTGAIGVPNESGQYEISVIFTRNLSTDRSLLEGNPQYAGMDFQEAAARLLREALQEIFKGCESINFTVDVQSVRKI